MEFIKGIPLLYWIIGAAMLIFLAVFLRPRKEENYGFRFPKDGPRRSRTNIGGAGGSAGAGVGAKRPVAPAPLAGHNNFPTE